MDPSEIAMTRLDLSRLEPHHALAVARRLLAHCPEGLEVLVRSPLGRWTLVYDFGPPWPGGRGASARPLRVYRDELGPPGETCRLSSIPAAKPGGGIPEGVLYPAEPGRAPSEYGWGNTRRVRWNGKV